MEREERYRLPGRVWGQPVQEPVYKPEFGLYLQDNRENPEPSWRHHQGWESSTGAHRSQHCVWKSSLIPYAHSQVCDSWISPVQDTHLQTTFTSLVGVTQNGFSSLITFTTDQERAKQAELLLLLLLWCLFQTSCPEASSQFVRVLEPQPHIPKSSFSHGIQGLNLSQRACFPLPSHLPGPTVHFCLYHFNLTSI